MAKKLQAIAVGVAAFAAVALCGALTAQQPGAAADRQELEIVRAPQRVVCDGRLDEWWDDPQITLSRADQVADGGALQRSQWGGPSDLSAELRVAFDDAHLYLAGMVCDDELAVAESHEVWHGGDALEVFLDLGPVDTPAETFDESVLQLFLMPFSPRRSWGVIDWRDREQTPRGANLSGIRFACVEIEPRPLAADAEAGSGELPTRCYTFEAVIPFHNFEAIEGKEIVGFTVALDDHDPSRPGRYQYMTWSGVPPVDARSSFGRARFVGGLPLQPDSAGGLGALSWLAENGPWILWPLLGVLALSLLLYAWSALNRIAPAFRPIGRGLGVAMFVAGLAAPGWFAAGRLADGEQRVRDAVATIQGLAPELRGSVLDDYRGAQRDETLVSLLRGGEMQREQRLRYRYHSEMVAGPGEPVLGAGTAELEELGMRVRDYGVPLPPEEVEVFNFREPLEAGTLIVVLARPLGSATVVEPSILTPFDPGRLDGVASGEQAVELAITAFLSEAAVAESVAGEAEESGPSTLEFQLDFTGTFAPISDPAYERLELTYGTRKIPAGVESLSVSCQAGEQLRLLGLTWQPEGAEEIAEQRPLLLGQDTLAGVPTDLREQYPRSAGVELRERSAEPWTLELDPASVGDASKLWLVYHGIYRQALLESPAPGESVCRLLVEFVGGQQPPLEVDFGHQRTMLFAQERYNYEFEDDGRVQVAHRWVGEDLEAHVDLVRRIDLPPGAVPARLKIHNTGPYAVRFRSLVFGEEVEGVVLQDRESAQPRRLVSEERGVQRLAESVTFALRDVEFAVYRGDRATASTEVGRESEDARGLPDVVRRLPPDEDAVVVTTTRGGARVHEAFVRLRGEAWSDAVLGATVVDAGYDEFVQRVNRIGSGLMFGALPVLLLLLAELLSVLNSLRIRLVLVLTVAALLPLLVLSLALVRVLETDHEQRGAEAVTEALQEVGGRLGEIELELGDSAEIWLEDLQAFVSTELATPAVDVTSMTDELRRRLEDQMPPAWGGGGFLRFEFSPRAEREDLPVLASAVGDPYLRDLETQLRAETSTQLVWGVPLVGVRRAREVDGFGTFALSAGRRLDADSVGGGSGERAIMLCGPSGYAVALGAPPGQLDALNVHAARTRTITERADLVEELRVSDGPVVRQHAEDGESDWLAAYQVVRGPQDEPRLLYGVLRESDVATLPLALGRVPVRAFFVGVAGILLLLALFLSYVVTARISGPIERLEQGAQALRAGRFDVRVDSEEGGQIGRLTRTFNHMASELRGRIDDLRSMNRSVRVLTSKLELDDVLGTAVTLFAHHSGADAVRLLHVDRERGRRLLVGGGDLELERDDPLVVAVLDAAGPLSIRLAPDEGGALEAACPGQRSALIVPLASPAVGRSRGAVLLLFESPSPHAVQLEMLWALATQTAAALENARLYHTAVEDIYTGALRPEFFGNRLVAQVAEAGRESDLLALCGVRFVDGAELARALGRERLGRLLERVVQCLRDTFAGTETQVCRQDETVLLVAVRGLSRSAAEEQLAAAEAGLRAAAADPAVPPRFAPVRLATAVAAYPEDAQSAEFLLDAMRSRLATVPGSGGAAAAVAAGTTAVTAAHGSGREPGPGIVLQSPAMQPVVRTLERVAPTDLTVLLLGETGTGKEVLADLIHRWSERASGPLVKVHCAALPEALLQSELFGHEKGAFTGAVERKIGRFELAERGTIFLDEIGEISMEVQVKLLRVLQEREIDRVGGTQPVPIDVRVIAATNRDIESMVADGQFREDLYYRLQGMLVRVPPLRDRKQEIPLLVEQFRQQAVEARHTTVEAFSPEAMDWLFRHDWPGNVRELRNTVFRSMVLARGASVDVADLQDRGGLDAELPSPAAVEPNPAPAPEEPAVAAPDPAAAVPSSQDAPPASEPEARPGEPPARARADVSGGSPSGRAERVIQLLRDAERVTTAEVSAALGVSGRTALRVLGELVESGQIERVGKRRGAHYRLSNSAAQFDK